MTRIAWDLVVVRAAEIVDSYDTSVTLRQLYYRLVSEQLIPNKQTAYKTLSERTAQARREGWFPDLIDRGRDIHLASSWEDPSDGMETLIDWYRRDRTEGQEFAVYLGVEKAGMVIQLQSWFGDLGVPILALGGYSSQSYVNEIKRHVQDDTRPAVLLYAGDWDPSGEDIDRDLIARTDCWHQVHRVGLTVDQVDAYGLPELPGKDTDSRAGSFVARHGRLAQVELDALPPEELRALYAAAIERFWDTSAYEDALRDEEDDRAVLQGVLDNLRAA